MEDTVITIEELYCALSDLFIDNEIDYKGVAAIAKNFSIDEVNTVFFTLIAPACYTPPSNPVPYIWSMYDPKELMENIEKQKKMRCSKNWIDKIKIRIQELYLRYIYDEKWNKLKNELDHS